MQQFLDILLKLKFVQIKGESDATMTAHVNIPDRNNKIYCYAQNKVTSFDRVFSQRCIHCRYYSGTAQGRGTECTWEDESSQPDVSFVYFPQLEYQRINNKE